MVGGESVTRCRVCGHEPAGLGYVLAPRAIVVVPQGGVSLGEIPEGEGICCVVDNYQLHKSCKMVVKSLVKLSHAMERNGSLLRTWSVSSWCV